MSWKDKAAAALVKGPKGEPTKLPEAPFVGFVSTPPAPISPQDDVFGPIAESFQDATNIQPIEPTPSPLTGLECGGCDRLEMRDEWQTGTRKRFFWRCTKGHELLEARRYGERITLSPPECEDAGDFRPWQAGTK